MTTYYSVSDRCRIQRRLCAQRTHAFDSPRFRAVSMDVCVCVRPQCVIYSRATCITFQVSDDIDDDNNPQLWPPRKRATRSRKIVVDNIGEFCLSAARIRRRLRKYQRQAKRTQMREWVVVLVGCAWSEGLCRRLCRSYAIGCIAAHERRDSTVVHGIRPGCVRCA